MSDWVTNNKGLGPWALSKGNWPTMEDPWKADQPNRPTYNEGNRISTYADPTWPMEEFSGNKITDTHDPCGYWTKDYTPPLQYAYFGTVGGTVLRLHPDDFSTVDTLQTSSDNFYVAAIDTVKKKALFGKQATGVIGEIVFVDLDTFTEVGKVTLAADEVGLRSIVVDEVAGIAYVTAFDPSSEALGWIIKLNINTMTRISGRLSLTGDSSIGMNDSGADDSTYTYFLDDSYGGQIFRVKKSDFSDGGYIWVYPTDPYLWQGGYGKELIETAQNLLYFSLFGRFSSYDSLIRINTSTFTYIDRIDFAVGETLSMDPVLDLIRRKVYVLVTNPTPDKIIKIDLASFTREATIDYSSVAQSAATYDKDRDYIYLGGLNRITRVKGDPFEQKETITVVGSIVSAVYG